MSDDARKWAEGKQLVMHLATGIVGRAAKYYDGKPDGERYRATPTRAEGDTFQPGGAGEHGAEVTAPVLVVEPGHALLWREGAFVALGLAEARYYAVVRDALHTKLMELAGVGAAMGVTGDSGVTLYRAALGAQLRALAPGRG